MTTKALTPSNGNATILDQGEFEYWTTTEHGIQFKENTPQDVWLAAVKQITSMFSLSFRLHCRSMFILADALNDGEKLFGEKWAQAIDDTRNFVRLHSKTIHNSMWVASKVAPERRRELLTLTHHEIVAKLPDEEQEAFLALAEHEGLNTKELKEKVREKHPSKPREGKNGTKPNTSKIEETPAAMKGALTQVSNWMTANEDKVGASFKPLLEHFYKLYRRKWMTGHKR